MCSVQPGASIRKDLVEEITLNGYIPCVLQQILWAIIPLQRRDVWCLFPLHLLTPQYYNTVILEGSAPSKLDSLQRRQVYSITIINHVHSPLLRKKETGDSSLCIPALCFQRSSFWRCAAASAWADLFSHHDLPWNTSYYDRGICEAVVSQVHYLQRRQVYSSHWVEATTIQLKQRRVDEGGHAFGVSSNAQGEQRGKI